MLKEISPVFQLMNAVPISGTTTYTSSNSQVLYKDSVGYQVNFTGSPVGVLQVNGSLDFNPGTPQSRGSLNAGNWTTISSTSITAASPSVVTFNLNQLAAPYVQLQFISSTASGTLTAFFVAKSLG